MERGSYVQEHHRLEAAIASVKNGEMRASKAARHFVIPLSTLYDKLHGRHPKKMGKPTAFTKEEENEICDILLNCMKIGVPLNKRMLMRVVKAVGLAKGKYLLRLTLDSQAI